LELQKRMKNIFIALSFVLISSIGLAAGKALLHPHIEIVTTEGTIRLELDAKQAPITVAHVLQLIDDGFYDNTLFHRVIPGFMAQGGGFTPSSKLKESDDSIPNESGNGMSILRGTIAMARTNDPHSANSQFFINVSDNDRLDPNKSDYNGTWGYTVFGYVIDGMDIVDKISAAETRFDGKLGANTPAVPIVIKTVSRVTFD
jgi:cyclophilin family peptidyl-prolyl cis-trans isomerase